MGRCTWLTPDGSSPNCARANSVLQLGKLRYAWLPQLNTNPIGGRKMKSPLIRILRFLAGFVVGVITCPFALDHAVLREQLILLAALAIVVGLICSFSDKALKAISDHWTF